MKMGDLTVTGRLRQGAGAAVAALQARALEWDLPLAFGADDLTMLLWEGELRLMREGDGARLTIRAPERRIAQVIRGALAELFEAEGIACDWESIGDEGALAPGLSLMRLVAVDRPSPGFLRVTLQGPDAARFAMGGLHFRLLLPPAGRRPVWPRLNAAGRAVWPEGDDALHRPVYTLAEQSGDLLAFDIWRHANSPTCSWAESATPGQEVGIIGPGGGWCPEAPNLFAFGDATALPALRRMRALCTGEMRIWTTVAAEDLGDLADDARLCVTRDLLAALDGAQAQITAAVAAGVHVWFAGHEAEARAARARLASWGLAKRDFTAMAYWS